MRRNIEGWTDPVHLELEVRGFHVKVG